MGQINLDTNYRPEYIGIKWPREQRLPDPNKEITLETFLRLMHASQYAPIGMTYNQLTLDWGQGPLEKEPRVTYENVRATIVWPNLPQPVYESIGRNNFQLFGELLSWTPTNPGSIVAETCVVDTKDGIVRVPPHKIYWQRVYRGAGGWDSFQNFWGTTFWFFPHYALAVAHAYTSLPNTHYVQGMGVYTSDGWTSSNPLLNSEYKYLIRFFKIGCEHKWKELTTKDALALGFHPIDSFDHCYICERCGEKNMVNSSD